MAIKKQYVNWFPLYEDGWNTKNFKFITQKDFKGLKELAKKKNQKLLILDDFASLINKLKK